MRIIPVFLTPWLAVATPIAAQTQTNNWPAVRALTSGQEVRVSTQSQEIAGEFQSATETQLVVTRRGKIVYLARPTVQRRFGGRKPRA
jgi:hypothetical protein